MIDSNLRVLVVEPNRDVRQAIVSIVKTMGIQTVRNVTNGAEALEVLQGNPIDLIICEWDLPILSGMELLRSVRESMMTRYILFFTMSGKGQLVVDDLLEAADYDVDGHLIKPITQEDLVKWMKRALQRRKETLSTLVHLDRAGAFIDVRAFEEADSEIESARSESPRYPRILVELGKLFEERERDEDAKACYQEASELSEVYAKAHENMAGILEKEGREEEAFEMLQRSADLNPRNRARQFKLAKAFMKKSDEEGARQIVYRTLGEGANDAARNAAAAEFFLEAGRADLAEVEYAFALAADPGNVHYYNRMGIAFRRQKKYQEAIDNYRKAIKVSPDNAVLYYNMGIALTEERKNNEAIAALRKSLYLQPDFPQAESILKRLSSRT